MRHAQLICDALRGCILPWPDTSDNDIGRAQQSQLWHELCSDSSRHPAKQHAAGSICVPQRLLMLLERADLLQSLLEVIFGLQPVRLLDDSASSE